MTAQPNPIDASLPDLQDLLGQDQVEELIGTTLACGAQFAEVYGEYTVSTSVALDEARVKEVSYGVISGVGVRAIRGEVTGYAYADAFDMPSLKRAAESAAVVAARGTPGRASPLSAGTARAPFVLADPLPARWSTEQKIALCQAADEAGRASDRRIHNMQVQYGDVAKRVLVANSDGALEMDERYICRLGVSAMALDGTQRQTASRRYGGAVEANYFEQHSAADAGHGAARAAVALLDSRAAPAGTMPVVVGPGWGGVLVHECFGHSLEGDGVRKQTSIRASQLGQRVAAPGVSIYDDGTVAYSRGSFRVDDEGTPSQKTLVVDDGILRGYLWDLLNGRLSGNASTGNGRRASYRHYPIPRMTNTYIAGGDADPGDIVRSIRKGFYCANMGGGSVNPADGNFSFHVTEGFWIEDGRLTAPVSNATLTGNGNDAMLHIEMIGNDLEIDTTSGSCGKAGQYAPVGVGQPTVKFRAMTVGGLG